MLKRIKNFYFLIVIFCFLFFVFDFTEAAILYLAPAQANYYQGDNFILAVRINTQGECINTIEAHLDFPTSLLEIKDVSQGNSILSLWLAEPEFSNQFGEVSFSGGIPGGYCGIIPGDPGESNLLARLIFEVKREPLIYPPVSLKIKFLKDSRVLLNDGLGTPAETTSQSSQITILSGVPVLPKQEWQAELEKDVIPPEEFEVILHQDPDAFEGKYFITFSSSDKQTGIDHYQVKEGKSDWQRITSPSVLADQKLKGAIQVKAVDKAGNERISEVRLPKKPFPYLDVFLGLFNLILVLLIIIKHRLIHRANML